jgi:hypothetical protein
MVFSIFISLQAGRMRASGAILPTIGWTAASAAHPDE